LNAALHPLPRTWGGTGNLADAWTVKATEDRIAAAGDVLAIGTERSEDVQVKFEVLTSAPVDDGSEWDHVTESSIGLPCGELAVLGRADA
jgi:hypothetical protein